MIDTDWSNHCPWLDLILDVKWCKPCSFACSHLCTPKGRAKGPWQGKTMQVRCMALAFQVPIETRIVGQLVAFIWNSWDMITPYRTPVSNVTATLNYSSLAPLLMNYSFVNIKCPPLSSIHRLSIIYLPTRWNVWKPGYWENTPPRQRARDKNPVLRIRTHCDSLWWSLLPLRYLIMQHMLYTIYIYMHITIYLFIHLLINLLIDLLIYLFICLYTYLVAYLFCSSSL